MVPRVAASGEHVEVASVSYFKVGNLVEEIEINVLKNLNVCLVPMQKTLLPYWLWRAADKDVGYCQTNLPGIKMLFLLKVSLHNQLCQ